MKVGKTLAIVLGGYVLLVVAFESLIGVVQPQSDSTLVITTTDASGESADRVVARLETDGRLYVAANHWPRAWYRQALANPQVEVVIDGVRSARTAVPVSGTEHERVDGEHALGLGFRFLTGFPPRYLLRLDPR